MEDLDLYYSPSRWSTKRSPAEIVDIHLRTVENCKFQHVLQFLPIHFVQIAFFPSPAYTFPHHSFCSDARSAGLASLPTEQRI